MGDVKPLLNEQTTPTLPWGIKSENWDGDYGSVSNAKEVFGPETKNVRIFSTTTIKHTVIE